MPWVDSGNDVYITSGRVGIGTSTPSQLLHVSGPEGAKILFDGGATQVFDMPTNDAEIHLGDPAVQNDPSIFFWGRGRGAANGFDSGIICVGNDTGLTGDGNGLLRIRTYITEIRTEASSARVLKFKDFAGSSIIEHQSGGGIRFSTDNADLTPGTAVRMRIAAQNFAASSAVYTESDGKTLTTTAPSGTAYKENITDFEPDVSGLYNLRLKSFTWKSTGEEDFGFLAEDIRSSVPRLYRKDERVTGWRADRFPLYLFQALKQLKNRMDQLETTKH